MAVSVTTTVSPDWRNGLGGGGSEYPRRMDVSIQPRQSRIEVRTMTLGAMEAQPGLTFDFRVGPAIAPEARSLSYSASPSSGFSSASLCSPTLGAGDLSAPG